MDVILITGNKNKAEYFRKLLGIDIEYVDIDLDEIQSLDLREVIRHKVIQAYNIVNKPVIVEDVSLEFEEFGKLPGTFIKFFLQELSIQNICNLLNDKSRKAIARCIVGYYDGKNIKMFEGELPGKIPESPTGEMGFGWDKIFIPDGYNITRAEMNEEDDKKTYLKLKRLDLLKEFLESI